jgi:hypothetical protein
MVAGDCGCLGARREGEGGGDDEDVGAGEDLGGASMGGSSVAVVGGGGCCGVWARDDGDETWGTEGDLAGGRVSRVSGSSGLWIVD